MIRDAAAQAWPPFVLVAGLLMVGVVAHEDGLFHRAGRALDTLPDGGAVLFAAAAVLVAVTTAILNLDTAVVFLTPVLVLAARHRGLDEEPFLYAAVFMANASSLYLPGSNLTNLLVGQKEPIVLPALAASLATALGLFALFASKLRKQTHAAAPEAGGEGWISVPAVVIVAVLVVALDDPALPVLAVGIVTVLASRVDVKRVVEVVSPHVLTGLFVLSVALGTLARAWDGPAQLVDHATRAETAAIGAIASVLVNNLPAAVLLSAQHVPHRQELLYGLNIGPNLAVTGSLSAFLWFKAARQVDALPSVKAFPRRGIVLAPIAIAVALLA